MPLGHENCQNISILRKVIQLKLFSIFLPVQIRRQISVPLTRGDLHWRKHSSPPVHLQQRPHLSLHPDQWMESGIVRSSRLHLYGLNACFGQGKGQFSRLFNSKFKKKAMMNNTCFLVEQLILEHLFWFYLLPGGLRLVLKWFHLEPVRPP